MSSRDTPSFGDLFDDPMQPASPSPDAEDAAHVPDPIGQVGAADAVPGLDSPRDAAAVSVTAHDAGAAVSVAAHDAGAAVSVAAHDTGAAVSVAADSLPEAVIAGGFDTPVPARPAPAPRVDTGRLYRSAGAEGPATLTALPAMDPTRMRSTSTTDTGDRERDAPGITASASSPEPQDAGRNGRRSRASLTLPAGARGLTYSGVMVVVTAATVVAGFIEAVLRHEIGWLTGLVLLASSVYCALMVRKADVWAAVVAPPLAFLAATLTAGQLTFEGSGHLLLREGYGIFRTLAVNAPWILATTVICLGIALWRRSRP